MIFCCPIVMSSPAPPPPGCQPSYSSWVCRPRSPAILQSIFWIGVAANIKEVKSLREGLQKMENKQIYFGRSRSKTKNIKQIIVEMIAH